MSSQSQILIEKAAADLSQLRKTAGDSSQFLFQFASTIPPEKANDGPPPLDWGWGETILSIPLTLIVLGTIIGNFLVLYSFATRPKTLRSPTHFFIANLALADFLVGILVMPFLATLQLTSTWYFGQTFCTFWTVTHFWLCSASILSTCAVCIERFVGVRHPLRHMEIMNSMTLGGIIVCVWILAGFLSLLSIFAWPQPYDGKQYQCRLNHQLGHVIVAVVFILYIPAGVMITLYWRIYAIATQHLNQFKRKSTVTNFDHGKMKGNSNKAGGTLEGGRIQPITIDQENSSGEISSTSVSFSSSSGSEAEGSSVAIVVPLSGNPKQSIASSKASSSKPDNDKVHMKKQINLAKRLSLLVGILLVSYVPFFTIYLVKSFHPNSINDHVFSFFGWIRYFNSCVNPFIYAFAVPAYRKVLTEIVCMGKCCK